VVLGLGWRSRVEVLVRFRSCGVAGLRCWLGPSRCLPVFSGFQGLVGLVSCASVGSWWLVRLVSVGCSALVGCRGSRGSVHVL